MIEVFELSPGGDCDMRKMDKLKHSKPSPILNSKNAAEGEKRKKNKRLTLHDESI